MGEEYREYRLEGGPKDGERVTTSGAREVVIPIMRPLEVVRKVVAFRRGPEPRYDEVRYYRTGDVYRWEGLIDDAWCYMAVADQMMAEGGSAVRRVVREQMRRTLEDMAPGKELGRIVWRIMAVPYPGMHRVRALVGPRRVERGLQDRESRRVAVTVTVTPPLDPPSDP